MAQRGRPKVEDKKSELITFWVRPQIKRELEDLSARINTSQSEIARDALVLFLGIDLTDTNQNGQEVEGAAV